MIKMMKRNVRSLVFLIMIVAGAVGFVDLRPFAVPAEARVDNSNQSQARTKSHPRTGGSATKAPAVCRKRCDEERAACLTSIVTFQCKPAHDQCLEECKR